jgi:hypothetical protein
MFENNLDVLVSEDFDELCISPKSRRAQFQPAQIIPEPTSVTIDDTSKLEPAPTDDSGNRRSQRAHKTAAIQNPLSKNCF